MVTWKKHNNANNTNTDDINNNNINANDTKCFQKEKSNINISNE